MRMPEVALRQEGANWPLPGVKRRALRANRGRRTRLWSFGWVGRSEMATTQGESA